MLGLRVLGFWVWGRLGFRVFWEVKGGVFRVLDFVCLGLRVWAAFRV